MCVFCFVISAFDCVEEVPLYFYFVDNFHYEKLLVFIKLFFYMGGDNSVAFVLYTIDIMYYIN